jgi:hypothetical protein
MSWLQGGLQASAMLHQRPANPQAAFAAILIGVTLIITFLFMGGKYAMDRCRRLNDRDEQGQCRTYLMGETIQQWWRGE